MRSASAEIGDFQKVVEHGQEQPEAAERVRNANSRVPASQTPSSTKVFGQLLGQSSFFDFQKSRIPNVFRSILGGGRTHNLRLRRPKNRPSGQLQRSFRTCLKDTSCDDRYAVLQTAHNPNCTMNSIGYQSILCHIPCRVWRN